VVYMAISSDATCRGLRSPKEGPLVLELTEGKIIFTIGNQPSIILTTTSAQPVFGSLLAQLLSLSIMMGHEILLKRLENSYGLKRIFLQWLQSYLSEHIPR